MFFLEYERYEGDKEKEKKRNERKIIRKKFRKNIDQVTKQNWKKYWCDAKCSVDSIDSSFLHGNLEDFFRHRRRPLMSTTALLEKSSISALTFWKMIFFFKFLLNLFFTKGHNFEKLKKLLLKKIFSNRSMEAFLHDRIKVTKIRVRTWPNIFQNDKP